MKKYIFSLLIFSIILIGCASKVEKQDISLHISGMTCEIGCAKIIQSKLSKHDGVLAAKIVFKDSIAYVNFDSNKTSKKEMIAFINGIAGGDLYRVVE